MKRDTLSVIKKGAVYSAHYLQQITKWDLTSIEDQLHDLWILLDEYLYKIQSDLETTKDTSFGGKLYWQDQEVQIMKLYLQDLIFERPDDDPADLAKDALAKAKVVIDALKQTYSGV